MFANDREYQPSEITIIKKVSFGVKRNHQFTINIERKYAQILGIVKV